MNEPIDREYVAVYFKNPNEDNPLECELHCWRVVASSEDKALAQLEKSAYVPYRVFLRTIAEVKDLDKEIANQEAFLMDDCLGEIPLFHYKLD